MRRLLLVPISESMRRFGSYSGVLLPVSNASLANTPITLTIPAVTPGTYIYTI